MNPLKNRKLRRALLGATLALPSLAVAQVNISTAEGAGADTWLDNDDPTKNGDSTTNFGTAGAMEVRNFETARMRYALVRFDISALDASSDNSNGSISLAQTFGANRSRDWNVYLLRDGFDNSGVDPNKTENWSETSVSYDTCPGITGLGTDDAPPFDTDLNIYDAGTNPTGAWELIHTEVGWGIAGIGGGPAIMPNLALNTAIEDAISADTDGQITFLLMLAASDNQNYFGIASKESAETVASYPTLVLPNATAGDADMDGLADNWEIEHFILAGEDPVADAATIIARQSGTDDSDTDDGLITGDPMPDGFDNEAEETAGSDPLDPLSIPTDIDADGLADSWEVDNFMLAGEDPVADLVIIIARQDGLGDPDADWGINEDEETAMTDPNDRASFLDDDGGTPDGQNDWWEIQYFGDTSTSTSGTDDIEPDTFDNDAEYAAYSDPNNAASVPGDIDGDGVPDIWEDQYYGNNDGIITDVGSAADLDGTDGTLDNEPDGFTDLQESTAVVPSNPFDATSVPDNADGDTLDDTWEINFFGDIYTQNGLNDDDNDLYTNEEEETAGTDPTDNLDYVDDIDMDEINDRWEMKYFMTLDGSEGADGTDDFFEDSDGDEFLNDEEYDLLSNPNDIASVPDDIDGDGLLDTNEIAFWGDIYTHDGDDDPDRDYSTNLEEEAAVTDPTNRASSPDTDNGGLGDGLGDGWEIFSFGDTTTTEDPLDDNDTDTHDNAAEYAAATNGNDPLSTPDTDGDGLPDGWEIFHFIEAGEDPVADVATIIARQGGQDDSDGGGASNQLEFFAGTDPNDMGVDDPTPGELTTAIGNGADTMLTNDNQNAFYNPGNPHGDAGTLEARNNTDARQRINLLRFDVSTLSGDLSNLILQMNCNAAPRTRSLPIYGLLDGNADENWDEATTTYLTGPGLIAAEVGVLNQFARDPEQLRFIGTLDITQGVTGVYLTNPNLVDLASFVADDTNGIVTLAIAGVDNNQFQFTSKEGAVAPTIIAPLGTVTPPPADPKVTSVTLDTDTNTFTMSVEGLVNGSQYHVESLVPPAATFSAVAGSTFTATTDPEDVPVTADEIADPTQLFRLSDGAEPAP